MNPIYHEYQLENGLVLPEIKWTGDPNIDSLLAQERWLEVARPSQLIPPEKQVYGYVFFAGRGFGKTLTGGHEIRDAAFKYPGSIMAVFNVSADKLWKFNFEGVSGFRKIIPESCIVKFNKRPAEIELWNGSMIWGFSADDPDVRGGEFGKTWFDEYAIYKQASELLSNIVLSMRGKAPYKTRIIITTTPRATPSVREIAANSDYIKVFSSTLENRHNLDDFALREIMKLDGTRRGNQEIYGQLLEDDESLIFKDQWFQIYPADARFPSFSYIFQSWDTASTVKTGSDKSAWTTWGVFFRENGANLMLLDAQHDKMEYPAMKAQLEYEFQTGKGPNRNLFLNTLVVEAKGHGLVLYQDLQRSFPVVPYNPGTKDKVTRASLVSWVAEQGRVWIPEDPTAPGELMPYAHAWREEMTTFSKDEEAIKSQEDDYVDTTTQAWKHVLDLGYITGSSVASFRNSSIIMPTQPTIVNPYRLV